MNKRQIIVIGAGVSGLTSALCLAEAGWPVTVWTAAMPKHTTSAVAGAVWGPRALEPAAKTLAWTERSLQEFRQLAVDPSSGVRMAQGLSVGGILEEFPVDQDMPPGVDLIPDLRPAEAADVPAGYRTGFRATMPLTVRPFFGQHVVLTNPGLSELFMEMGGDFPMDLLFSASAAHRLRRHQHS